MKKLTLFLLFAANMAHASCDIPQAFWDWPRSADAVLSVKEIRPCIDAYLAKAGSSFVIHHGTDDESALHADELRAWLVSLAISPSSIADAPENQKALSIETR